MATFARKQQQVAAARSSATACGPERTGATAERVLPPRQREPRSFSLVENEIQVEERRLRCTACPGEFTTRVVTLAAGTTIPPQLPTLCPACVSHREARRREDAEQRARARRADPGNPEFIGRLKAAGIHDEKLWPLTLDGFDPSEDPDALSAAGDFVGGVLDPRRGETQPWLFLTGPTGPGKTHILVGIDRALYVAGVPANHVRIVTAPTLVRQIQQTYSRGGGHADAIIESLVGVPVLLLDDLGRGKQSDDAVRILVEVLCERAGKRTAISSNYPRSGLEARHEDYEVLVSRLGPQSCRTVTFSGRDRRDDAPARGGSTMNTPEHRRTR